MPKNRDASPGPLRREATSANFGDSLAKAAARAGRATVASFSAAKAAATDALDLAGFPGEPDDGREEWLARKHKEVHRIRAMMRHSIVPGGKFERRWDLVMLLTMILIVVLTPLEIAFLDGIDTLLLIINLTMDVVLAINIVRLFRTPFREPARKGARLVYNPKRIAKHYLSKPGGFAFDLITSLPTHWFFYETPKGTWGYAWRLLRCNRMLRVLDIQDVLYRPLSKTKIDLSVLELVKLSIYTFVTAHWFACYWAYLGQCVPIDPTKEWDTWYVAERNTSWIEKQFLQDATPPRLYIISLYVSFSLIFGGPNDINPSTDSEYMAQVTMLVLGCCFWAYVIGVGVSILSTLYPHLSEHRRIIGMLNYYIHDKSLDADLAARLRTYFSETAATRYFAKNNAELMMSMTSGLRGESSLRSAGALFDNVWYLRPGSRVNADLELEVEFFSKLTLAAQVIIFVRREAISTENLIIVEKGLIARDGIVGLKVVGDDMIINDSDLRQLGKAKAITSLVQTVCVKKDDFFDLMPFFPQARKCIRRAAVMYKLRRAILRAAKFTRDHAAFDQDTKTWMVRGKSWQPGAGRLARRDTPVPGESRTVPVTSLWDAFEAWNETRGKSDKVHTFEIKSVVEKRIDDVEEKVLELSKNMSARFDELLSSLKEGKKLRANGGTKLSRAAVAAAATAGDSAKKSVPPPLPRGGGSAPPPLPPGTPGQPLPVSGGRRPDDSSSTQSLDAQGSTPQIAATSVGGLALAERPRPRMTTGESPSSRRERRSELDA
jgi:hypothetical protein